MTGEYSRQMFPAELGARSELFLLDKGRKPHRVQMAQR